MLIWGTTCVNLVLNKKETLVEYQKIRFYGPFIKIRLEENDVGTKHAYPVSLKIETEEVSATDFSLLSEASKELYLKIGEFFLHTRLFTVKVNGLNTSELLQKELMKVPLC